MVARPNLYIRLVAVEGLDPRESPPASPCFHIILDAEQVSWRYRACNGGGNSMLRVSYHGMILAWGKVPHFCVDSSQSGDGVATVEAKAEAFVMREEVRDLVWRELQVLGMVEFDVEGEVVGLGYSHGKPVLYKGKAAGVSKGVHQMSGAQGAHPVGQTTPTTYESVGGGENRTRTDLRSREDQGNIQIEKVQDKVDDAAGRGVDTRAFGAKKEDPSEVRDAGTTGTGA
ncbi:hypothetical protein EJB05_17628, partial [Eragrostis curvula]